MLKLNEADVVAQVRGYLEHRGWRPIRYQRTVVQMAGGGAFSTAEPGQADLQFIRYLEHSAIPGASIVLWIEMKKKGAFAKCRCATKKPRQRCTACDQATWRERERRRGALVWMVDDIVWFMDEYNRNFGFLHSGDRAVGRYLWRGLDRRRPIVFFSYAGI